VDWFSWTVIVAMMLLGLMLSLTGARALQNSRRLKGTAVSASP
jgi:hypothetical protein